MNVNAARAEHGPVPSGDAALALRCKQGDPAAFAQLLQRHRKGVYRVAYAIVNNRDDAQDVAQEAFLRAYRAIGRLDHNRSFADWMRRITVNCAISSLRKRKRLSRHAAPEAELEGAMATEDPTQGASADELQRHVREALEMLPPQQRAAMTLFALEEMDLADVADAMGCARPTVRVHLHRARQRLRGLLSKYLAESTDALKGDDVHEM